MIRLYKVGEPQVLIDNAASWTRELMRLLNNGHNPSKYLLGRYAHPEIKAALLVETSEKCAYCESMFRHVTYGDIEHIQPKAPNPDLRFSWSNLTIACDVCNTNKSDKVGIIDPYAMDPALSFRFEGPLIWGRANDDAALLTEIELQLNRSSLVERRTEKLSHIRSLVISASGKPPDVGQALIELARREVGSEKQFSACSHAALENLIAEI